MEDNNHGFIRDELQPEHYMFGGYSYIDGDILLPGGHGWLPYKQVNEHQSHIGLETMNCTNYGTLQALGSLAAFKRFQDFPLNSSERYSGVLTGTSRSGNSPHTVIEIIRKSAGVVPDAVLPFSDNIITWDQYYSPNPMDVPTLTLGASILDKFTIGHEWVFNEDGTNDKTLRLKNALQYGPVCVSVYAWRVNPDGFFYKLPTDIDQHWVQVLDFKEGEYWLIFDHYDAFEKKLVWDYPFESAKVYYLDRKETQLSKLQQLLSLCQQVVPLLQKLIALKNVA